MKKMINGVAYCNEQFWRKACKDAWNITQAITKEFVFAGAQRNPDIRFIQVPTWF